MSAKTDKARDDKAAKRAKKVADKRAKSATTRKDQFSGKIAGKDKAEALEKFLSAKGDVGTAQSEVAAALQRVAQQQVARQAASLANAQATSASTQSDLAGIASSNDAANMGALSKMGLSSVGTLNSGRNAGLNAMIAQMQGQFAQQNLQGSAADEQALGTGYNNLNAGAAAQSLRDHTNQYNDNSNKINRDLGDTYDQSRFDLGETLRTNQYDLKDNLYNNNQSYAKAKEYEAQQAAARRAASRSIRGGGYGMGGYATPTGAPTMNTAAPASSLRAEVTANNLKRFREGRKGGFWDTAKPESGLTVWNKTFN